MPTEVKVASACIGVGGSGRSLLSSHGVSSGSLPSEKGI